MHPCLTNNDTVLAILSHIKVDSSNVTTGLRDLASLARTCRALQESALDSLWYTQGSLSPLLSLLPADVLDVAYEPSLFFPHAKLRFVFLKRAPTLHEWDKLLSYASRIRRLTLGDKPQTPYENNPLGIHHTALHTLLATCPVSNLFPNLLDLAFLRTSWTFGSRFASLGACLMRIIHPRLRSLTLETCPEINASLAEILALVVHTCPDLQVLDVSYFLWRCDQSVVITKLNNLSRLMKNFKVTRSLPRYPYNHTLTVSLSMDSILELGALSRLEAVEFHIEDYSAPSGITPQEARPLFPSLRRFTLHASSFQLSQRFIALVSSPWTQTLSLNVSQMARVSDMCNAFTDMTRFRHLDTIAVSTPFLLPSSSGQSRSLLKPLLALSSLRSVTISITRKTFPRTGENSGTVELSNDLRAIPLAWPNLQALDLTWLHSDDVTLSSIAELASHCKNLKTLGIFFDGRIFEEIYTPSRLEVLKVGNSPIHAYDAAPVLKRTFPNLLQLEFERVINPYWWEWEEVCRYLSAKGQENEHNDQADED
ncbi:hypothetical protein BV22DRAFT_1032746 [Leucogyrophana mollusca]|uniref:Uncharacterized protein n=1 Tax=Leucogyrophana mollusca TaxID=85980 RepID=A0ACB8BL48_9AGAM|nr:hypothetical protein BV22DRAFT_1032746 [Leucogyrophana mollusca]